jgi:hypothetical protein
VSCDSAKESIIDPHEGLSVADASLGPSYSRQTQDGSSKIDRTFSGGGYTRVNDRPSISLSHTHASAPVKAPKSTVGCVDSGV